MKTIAITQRIFSPQEYSEFRETIDLNWHCFMEKCSISILQISSQHNIERFINNFKIDGIVLSGGNSLNSIEPNSLNKLRDEFEKRLIETAINNKIPIIGVCRGVQILNEYFGGKVGLCQKHVKTRHDILFSNGRENVNSFHNYAITELGAGLVVDYRAEDGIIEGVSHSELKIKGIMWHPERETTFSERDINLFKEFFGESI